MISLDALPAVQVVELLARLTGRCALRREEDLLAVAERQPLPQPGDPYGRHHPDPAPAQRRPRYYQHKIAEGRRTREALRCLKRRTSNVIYARLRADARQAAVAASKDP